MLSPEALLPCLQAAAQQQSAQNEADEADEGQNGLTDASATTSSSASAVADKLPAAVKEAPSQVSKATSRAVSKAAKKSEGLKRKLETPKARSVRKKNWQAYGRQITRNVKQWSESHKPELGLIAIIVIMAGMLLYMFSRSSNAATSQIVSS